MLSAARCAGIAGIGEVAGPIGQLLPSVSPGYGFAAIIVAFVGRLHPIGILLASLLMSLLYLGGERAQMTSALPSAITGLFQGMLLFFLLAADVFIHYRAARTLRRAPAPRDSPRRRLMRHDRACSSILATLAAGTPLVFAALGELVTEKSGVLNLGVEGMMLVGAVVGVRGRGGDRQSSWLGVCAGDAGRRGAVAALRACSRSRCMANQVATGLALTIFGVGPVARSSASRMSASVVIDGITPLAIRGLVATSRSSGRCCSATHPLVYAVAGRCSRAVLVPVPHARGPRAARGRRVAAVGARDRLSGDRASATLADAVRRRDGRARRRLPRRSSTRRCGPRA